MTPHLEAKVGDYASTVLMPGDPLRAKWIAETYLTNVKQVNSVRNCLGFTGNYRGHSVSVQASGMGQPSLSIYAHELYETYKVDNIIRVGSCGGIGNNVAIGIY
jgi:purine-nucleoside phosphorylase